MSSKAKSKPTPEEEQRLRAAATEVPQTLSLELSAETWDALEICLEKFTKAWRESPLSPPAIPAFLPERPGLRQVAIVELIKLDMEHRHATKGAQTALEDYAAQFPELGGIDRMPVELIYEEFLVRRQSNPDLKIDEYTERYPKRAMELNSLWVVHEGPVKETPKSTSITSLRRPDALQVGERIDDFDLLALLGQGSFAKVFLARQLSLQRLVALKISAARGFESQTLAQLDHPNIVRVYDQRRLPERNMQLLYMQYMPGGTLSDVVQRVKRTPAGTRSSQILLDVLKDRLNEQGEGNSDLVLPSAIRGASWWMTVTWLGMHLAGALDHAHAKGVLHRDLKPANVLLGRDGNPRLADFNVSASTVVASHVSAAYFGGSLAYMSPEQLEAFGAPVEQREGMMDGRSDVFSLGILLWEVLMGSRPFRDEQITDLEVDTLVSLANRRRTGPTPEDWKALAAEAPQGLVDFFQTCLAAKPEDRFASAAAARRALTLCGSESNLSLLQPDAKSRWLRFRRHPSWPVIIAGLIPSVLSSVLNISLNVEMIVDRLLRRAESDESRQIVKDAFFWSMVYINPPAYMVGVAIAVFFVIPITWAAASMAHGGIPTLAQIRPSHFPRFIVTWWLEIVHFGFQRRHRSPSLGLIIAIVTVALWAISGPAFPIILRRSGVELQFEDYLHFIASQAICGVLAASLAFTLSTFVSLRTVIPSLIDARNDDPAMHEGLSNLRWYCSFFEFLSILVIGSAAILIFAASGTDSKVAFVIFMVVGMLCSGLAYVLNRSIIVPDISSLQAATMIEESMGGDTQSSLAATSRRARK